MSEEIRVTFSCKKCGSDALTVADKSDDASPVICTSCGTVAGTWGEAKAAALQQTKEAVKKEFKDRLSKALEGNENIRIE